jgi:hypothetical protein
VLEAAGGAGAGAVCACGVSTGAAVSDVELLPPHPDSTSSSAILKDRITVRFRIIFISFPISRFEQAL